MHPFLSVDGLLLVFLLHLLEQPVQVHFGAGGSGAQHFGIERSHRGLSPRPAEKHVGDAVPRLGREHIPMGHLARDDKAVAGADLERRPPLTFDARLALDDMDQLLPVRQVGAERS